MSEQRRFMVTQTHRGERPFYWQPATKEWFADRDKGKVYKQREAAERAAETWGGEVVEVHQLSPTLRHSNTREAQLQRALAENRDAQLVIAALVESLGGEVTIPASALVDAPRTITVERGLDRSITLRTGEA